MTSDLAEFTRDRRLKGTSTSSRVMAGALTALVYGFMALLAWLPPPSPPELVLSETTAILLPEAPRKVTVRPPPPFLAPLIKPHAESVSPPDFTVASAVQPAPAPLSASATLDSPLLGGTTADTSASSGSANGTDGNGKQLSGCFDAVWAQAVTDRIGRFFRYPRGGATGVVMVQFTVRRTGGLDMLRIDKSSGDDRLDHAAYEAVRRAPPLPAIPDRMHTERITVELPVDFGIAGLTFQPSAGTCGG